MDKYGHARNRVQLGKWVVDAGAGVIYGRFGKQIGKPTSLGYMRATLYVNDGQFDVYLHRVIWESCTVSAVWHDPPSQATRTPAGTR